MPGRGLSQQSGSNSASSLCGGGRSVLVLCFSHITFGPISLSRFAHARRLAHLRQRFVRRCHDRMPRRRGRPLPLRQRARPFRRRALGLLRDYSRTYNERFDGFVVRKFNGEKVKIASGEVRPL